MQRDRLVIAGALSAIIAILAGTFAAHVAHGPAIDWLRTGSHYELIHAVAALALARTRAWRFSAMLMLAGANLFALTLYLLALGAPHWLGAITPLGGVGMIAGWLCLLIKEVRNGGERD